MTPCKCINGSNDLAMDERASKKTPGLRDLSHRALSETCKTRNNSRRRVRYFSRLMSEILKDDLEMWKLAASIVLKNLRLAQTKIR